MIITKNLNKMINVRIMFLVLSVVTTFNCNDVSAANSNNQIEILLETIIQKVDLLERNIENVRSDIDDVSTVVSKVEFKVDDLVTDVDNVKRDLASSIYNIMSDEVKKYNVNVEDVSRALACGYHFVGNGNYGHYDDYIYKQPLSFSQCVDMCKEKRDTDGEAWNSLGWQGNGNYCWCFKGERGHSPDKASVHFRI